MQKTILFISMYFLLVLSLSAQVIEVAAGVSSFHAPVPGYKIAGVQPLFLIGAHRYASPRQRLSIGIQVSLSKNNKQGDSYQINGLINYYPIHSKYINLNIGTGMGYLLSAYPGNALKWNGEAWIAGRKYKGVVPIPFDISLGLKRIPISQQSIQPFITYRLQAHMRYSPDLNPLPKSNLLIGFKIINSNQ